VSKLANPTEFLSSIYAYKTPLPPSWLQVAAVWCCPGWNCCAAAADRQCVERNALATLIGLLVIFVLRRARLGARLGHFVRLFQSGSLRGGSFVERVEIHRIRRDSLSCGIWFWYRWRFLLLRRRVMGLDAGAATNQAASNA
jgi:hypothetical protein